MYSKILYFEIISWASFLLDSSAFGGIPCNVFKVAFRSASFGGIVIGVKLLVISSKAETPSRNVFSRFFATNFDSRSWLLDAEPRVELSGAKTLLLRGEVSLEVVLS